MSDLYTRTSAGTSPVELADVKSYMKQTSTADDDLIQVLIDSATEYGEAYTGRAFRAQIWTLLIDAFSDRIALLRNPVGVITTIKYTVSGALTLIADTVYYLKKNVQCGEVLLQEDQDWPTDLDEVEHGIEIIFTTTAYQDINRIKDALYRHIAYLYTNRGDCDAETAGPSTPGR